MAVKHWLGDMLEGTIIIIDEGQISKLNLNLLTLFTKYIASQATYWQILGNNNKNNIMQKNKILNY